MIGATPVTAYRTLDGRIAFDANKAYIPRPSDGTRFYRLDDGRVVTVQSGYLFCLRCGRLLKSQKSQRRGYGPECARRERNRSFPAIPVVIHILE
jgi:hypothetical protein